MDDDGVLDAGDRAALKSHGLDLSPIAKISGGWGREATWVLSWTNPTFMGKQPTDNPADFVAEQCERGVPLFERTWVFFCRKMMEGRAEAAYEGKPKQ